MEAKADDINLQADPMAQLQYRQGKQLLKLLNTVHIHTKAGSKDSLPIPVSTHIGYDYTEVVDVRTPDEYHLDHIPGAINLPVLTNEERITIGTLYANNQFEARKRGAALISRNISRHIEEHFLPKSKEYSPLVYCWRGGQRSHSLGIILSQIGFQTFVLQGGHQKYRLRVREDLKTLPDQFHYRVISGMTGSGKTCILNALREKGEQVLDLEGLAKHKGSVLGLWHKETQPSQKLWESNILHTLQQFTLDRPVWVESESKRIGSVTIPERLFTNICHAPRHCITLPLEERVQHIIQCYPNWIEESDHLKHVLELTLIKIAGRKMVEAWHEMVDRQEWEEFVRHILVNHYDPSYQFSQKKNNISGQEVEQCSIPDLKEQTVDELVCSLIGKANQASHIDDSHAISLQ